MADQRSIGSLLRPHAGSFAAVVVLQVIGAIAGLAPLLAVVELGRSLLAPGPVDRDHVWTVVLVGAIGLLVRLVFTAASSGIGHLIDGKVQLSFRRLLADRLVRSAPHRRTGQSGR
jgi:ATP-binding cassette, subfamily B, bacterial IrtA/YbtP